MAESGGAKRGSSRPGGGSTYRSRELRLVLAIAAVLLAAGWLALAAVDRSGHLLFLDFREWRLTATPDPASSELGTRGFARFTRSLHPVEPARRPFRLTLELPAPPRRGHAVAAQAWLPADPEESYCFEVWTWNPRPDAGGVEAAGAFRVIASVDGEPAVVLPIGEAEKARRIEVGGIRPRRERVLVRLEVRALVDRQGERWQRASRTHFEYASWRPCRG